MDGCMGEQAMAGSGSISLHVAFSRAAPVEETGNWRGVRVNIDYVQATTLLYFN